MRALGYVLVALALAGCGRAEGGEIATVNDEGTTVVAALGDSIHAGSPYWDPDPDVRRQIGEQLDPQSQWEYWAAQRDSSLRFRNGGVYGERTDQIAKPLERCAARRRRPRRPGRDQRHRAGKGRRGRGREPAGDGAARPANSA